MYFEGKLLTNNITSYFAGEYLTFYRMKGI